jgi:hypothetical protein
MQWLNKETDVQFHNVMSGMRRPVSSIKGDEFEISDVLLSDFNAFLPKQDLELTKSRYSRSRPISCSVASFHFFQ